MTPAEVSLAVESVSKNFGGLAAVKEVSLRVERGERRGILGPNGAGKTTLFNLIAGDLKPSAGKILLHGQDITHMPNHQRAYLGMARTFQITNLFPNMTVIDNLLLAAQALDRAKFSMFRPIQSHEHIVARAERALEQIKMGDLRDIPIKHLSYGVQRQIEVALALVEEPKVLLLDEPTAGLSPAESAEMVGLLKELDPGITILIIEHDMDVAFELTDRLTVMHEGSILADGPKDEVRNNQTVQEIYLGYG
ncbi:MAG: ABC transporter ATP-binding protein [Candidatus Tectomicrobia bacterium RIFCSPLOWO2_12_FULL_69_37]|nr:MAG: ABC transporter ATP-binding protein [Candidatus Tectomicrobia bacterium RIFCSPLOWO2_02_FULL_70_19]OGL62942.1 MAG: ABC transporter ATP-binding protein [Candidatus Tectomicrobia bacterium RIFCSPLOWO2_12_FULL_69_37]